MKPKNKKKNKPDKTPSEEWDFNEGFGGIPEDVDLTKNIGCASNKKSKKKGN
ncbi:hypothetical protein [Echinicola shivajiensis]|uniref:hypothetical protein n=1 Tax=Echinicola shivajiensis TaxID=1035916 RepID=UPI001BFC2F5B|nr:hypothetical protein [Echinicola shivajiensis]